MEYDLKILIWEKTSRPKQIDNVAEMWRRRVYWSYYKLQFACLNRSICILQNKIVDGFPGKSLEINHNVSKDCLVADVDVGYKVKYLFY